MACENSAKLTPEIGEELGVTIVLRGVVQIEQNQIRVGVRLINVCTDKAIWVENYSGPFSSSTVVGIQREITLGLAESLNVELYADDLQRLESIPTKHLDWYQNSGAHQRLESSMP